MDEDEARLSALLASLSERTGRLTVRDVMEHFGPRGFGAILFIFAVPNLLPLPPGSSTLLAIPLLLVAPQLALGAEAPWAPNRVVERTVDPNWTRSLAQRVNPFLKKAEAVTWRRLPFMFGGIGDRALGAVCTLLAAVLVLPIPLGNLLPATAITILAFSLVQRDGLLALTGYAVATASFGVLVLSGNLVAAAVARLLSWVELA